MGLRFILGRAGSGKTRGCLQEIGELIHEDPGGDPLLLLVPEQATFQMESALLHFNNLHGMMRGEAGSFKRLSWKILEEEGDLNIPAISKTGKLMLVKSLLLENRYKLKLFYRTAREPGFLSNLSSALAEFKIYGITPKDMLVWLEEEKRKKENHNLAAKIHDLAILYEAYLDYMAERCRDSEDYLALAEKRINANDYLQKACVWVDSFAGFTPQEYRFLKELLKTCRQVNVSLCLDPEGLEKPPTPSELFHPTKETYFKLLALAKQEKVMIEEPLLLPGEKEDYFPRFAMAPELAYLEQKWLEDNPAPYEGKPSGLEVWQAANRRVEVEAAAREIIHLCRQKSFRYKDVAVLVRDLELYEPFFATVFDDYSLPYFLDRKQPVHQHPLVELLRSALEIGLSHWAPEPVFRFLKTDLAKVSREDVDLLENYVLEHGIKGEASWLQKNPWHYYRHLTLEEDTGNHQPEKDELLAEVHRIRMQVREVLEPFCQGLKEYCQGEEVMPGDVVPLVFNLLEQLEVEKSLQSWQERDEKNLDPGAAREHRQAWNGVVEVLEQVYEHLGEKKMPLEQCLQIIYTGLEELRMGQIPPALDQVLVGQVDRSRQPPLKATLILGVNEGSFPRKTKDDALLSDKEKQILAERGLELAPDSRQQLYHEQYQCYIAITRASSLLYVSYPSADEEGQALLPSPIIAKIKSIFPQLEEKNWPVELRGEEQLHYLAEPESAAACLLQQLRLTQKEIPLTSPWKEYYQYLVEGDPGDKPLTLLQSSLNYSNQLEELPSYLLEDVFKRKVVGSISRLEKFAACPFSHYASYWLRLKERPLHRLDAPGMGVFYHAALKEFVAKLQAKNLDWGELQEREELEILKEVMAELTPRLQGEILLSSSRYRYLASRLEKALGRALGLLRRQAKLSSFRPDGVEVEFGGAKGMPPLVIKDPTGKEMNLYGRIDRLDAARQEDDYYLTVIDYKSRSYSLDLSDFYDGINLQLLAYLQAAIKGYEKMAGINPVPGGAFYFGITSQPQSFNNPLTAKEAEKELRRRHKLKGLVLGDKKLIKMMDHSFEGESDILPAKVNKDGSFSKHSSTVKQEEFKMLFQYLDNMLEGLFTRFAKGEIAVAPYYKQGKTPCSYCEYRPLCRFEGDIPEGGDYRFLYSKNNQETLEEIARLYKGGDESDG